jgi:hypothetical protein
VINLFALLLGAVVVLGVVALVALLVLRPWLLRLAAGSSAGKEALELAPARIHLERLDRPKWAGPRIAELDRWLEATGFERIGAFAIVEIPGEQLLAAVDPHGTAYAIAHETSDGNVWLDVSADLADGRTLTYSNNPRIAQIEAPAYANKVRLGGAGPELVYQRFLAERPQNGLAPAIADKFAEWLERAHARELDWRNARGGPNEEEIAGEARARGQELSAEALTIAKARQRAHAMRGLTVALEESLARGHSISGRYVFVHDQLGPEELFESVLRPLGAERPPELAKISGNARGWFRTLVEAQPEARRFVLLASVDKPLPADVYGPPRPEVG